MLVYCACPLCRYQFKATRLNPEIFTRGGLFGVPNRKTEAVTTIPVSPHLATRERQRRVEKEEEEGEKWAEFVARPVPKEILERVKVSCQIVAEPEFT